MLCLPGISWGSVRADIFRVPREPGVCVGEGGLDLEQTGLISSGNQMLLLPEEDSLTEQMESLACKSTGLSQNISHVQSNLVCEIPATGRSLA